MNSYGAMLRYDIEFESDSSASSGIYDLIIRSGSDTVYCTANAAFRPGQVTRVEIELTEKSCEKPSSRSGDVNVCVLFLLDCKKKLS